MPDHDRNLRPLFFGQRQKLRREGAQSSAERNEVHNPKTVEDREQQQGIFGRLSERFSLFDQQTSLLHGRLGFRRRIPLDVHEWGYERNLKPDLLTTQRRSAWQGGDLV